MLLALVLVVLMIFAAFSVDVGTAYAQRRQNQGSVDTAALAGGVDFLYNGGNFESMVQEVKDRVDKDMGIKVPDGAWDSCTDSGAFPILSTAPGYAPINGSPCISFERNEDTNALQMRVRLPDVASETSFAGVIGINKLKTHAVAEVNIGSPLGGAFPAFVYGGTPQGGVVCILSGPGGWVSPCAGSASGQFGTFQPYYYSSVDCESGNAGSGQYWTQAPALANGLDHLLARFIGDPVVVGLANERLNGGSSCTVLGANTVNNSTGFSNQTITTGLLTGDSRSPSFDGRLAGGPYRDGDGGTLNTAMMANLPVDNKPLWAFLMNPMPSAAPLTCKIAQQAPWKRNVAATAALQVSNGLIKAGGGAFYATPEDLMAGCLSEWSQALGPIFTADIAKSHRAVSVPRYWDMGPGSASTNYHIKDFVPAFLVGEFQKMPSGTTADAVADPKITHWAGDPINSSNSPLFNAWNSGGNMNQLLVGSAAVYVPCGALPRSICVPVSTDASGFGGEVNGVTLTK